MPQNAEFLYAAYAVVAVVLVGYAVTLWRRARTVERRLADLGAAPDGGAGRR